MTPAERKKFRMKAHSLKPVVSTGQYGLTENVLKAIEEAINYHELIKIRLRNATKDDRKPLAEKICNETGADLIQIIGQIAVLYRKNPNKTN